MAQRDVDLVIRAKDEAEKVVKSITDAINDFTEAQKGLKSSADKTEGSVQALGAAFGQLQKDLRGGNASDVLAQSLDKANSSVERLQKTAGETRQEVSRLDAEFKSSSQGVEQMRARLERSAQALSDGQTKLKKYKAELAASEQEVKKLTKAEKDLGIAGLEGKLATKTTAIARTEARIAELRKEIEATDKPTKRLTTSLDTNTSKLARQQTEVGKLTTQLEKARSKQGELAEKMAETGQKIESSNAAIARQKQVVAGLETEFEGVKTETAAVEKATVALGKALDKTNGQLARQESQLDKAQVELKQFAATSGEAEAAIRELSALSITGLEDDLRRQRRAMLESKREYVELTDRASELAAKMGRVGVPTREMVEDFEKLKIEARAAKEELSVQRETLERLGRVFRDAGTDMDSIAAAQARFVKLQGQAGNAIQNIRTKADQSAQSLERLHQGYQKTTSSAAGLAPRVRANVSAGQRELTVTEQLARAYRNLYGEKRTSLSLTQRLRGEVLSLVAAYGGLYGVIDVMRRTVDAYKTLEAAQARLKVAFDGDVKKVGVEMDFLRRNAERLGVEFGLLSTEYSKFLIATKNTALEGEKARKLFFQIAEAARVNRSSMEEMKGVFTAVTQIVNKNAPQMEELRQQLGDRLPGAIQLFADGLGVTTGELIKMMEQGELTAEALIPFGDELEKRFGPQLAESLQQTSAQMGRLQNAAFQALKVFGDGGFISSFNDLLQTLTTTLQSADAEAFIRRLSVAFGTLLDIIGVLVENFDLVVVAASAFVGIKMIPFVLSLTNGLGQLQRNLRVTQKELSLTKARAAAMGVEVTSTTIAVRRLSAAFKALLASTGIGLLVLGVSTAIGYWATKADEATEALNLHKKVVDQVRDAYDAVGGSVDDWREKLKLLTEQEIENDLRRIRSAIDKTKEALDFASQGNDSFWTNFFGYNLSAREEIFDVSQGVRDAVASVVDAFNSGAIPTGEEFIQKLDEVFRTTDDGTEEFSNYSEAVLKAARTLIDLQKSENEAQLAIQAKTGTVEGASAALEELSGRGKEAENAQRSFNEAFADLNDIVSDITKGLPSATKKQIELNENAADLASKYEAALTAARKLPDAIQRAAAEQLVLNSRAAGLKGLWESAASGVIKSLDNYTNGAEAAAELIRQKEGFLSTPEPDTDGALRVGFGSDTVTLDDGSVRKVTEGISVSVQQANEDLLRRISQEFIPAWEQAIGKERFQSFTPQTQAALVSLAYNYGKGRINAGDNTLGAVVKAAQAGSREALAEAIAARAGDNGGINQGRRLEEAGLVLSDAGIAAIIKEQTKLNEKRAEARVGLQDDLETLRQEAAVAREGVIAQEQQKELRQRELELKKVGLTLSEAEREEIKKQVAAKYALRAEEEAQRKAKEGATQAESKVNALLEQRRALQQNLTQSLADNEQDKANLLRDQIEAVNVQLKEAIERARAMWAAIGGPDADNALIKLKTLEIQTEVVNQKAQESYFSWKRVGDLFLNGLANAFDVFAQKVAEGMSIGRAAREAFLQFAADFLRQIAQMIIKQAIFNALSGTKFGNFLGIGVGTGHSGGMVGSSRVGTGNLSRTVNPAVFAGALRYHAGGLPGLSPNEVPIIAKKGEEVLPRDDPRHILNGGGAAPSSGPEGPPNVFVMMDAEDMIENIMTNTKARSRFFYHLNLNSGEAKAALNG